MKVLLIALFGIFTFTINGQQSETNTKKEIYDFVKEETIYLKELKLKKYYKNFDNDNFVLMFEGEEIDRKGNVKWAKKYLKKRNDDKLEFMLNAPIEEFFKDFDLYILTKGELEKDSKKAPIIRALGVDITENWNPKIEFTKNRYLICLLPKFDSSSNSVPKYGEFMIIQIIEKDRKKWKIYSSYQ